MMSTIALARLVALGACVFFVWWRVMPLLVQHIPLGYDPGLYLLMIDSYAGQLPYRDIAGLPTWIMRMYEPLYGLLTSLLSVW